MFDKAKHNMQDKKKTIDRLFNMEQSGETSAEVLDLKTCLKLDQLSFCYTS